MRYVKDKQSHYFISFNFKKILVMKKHLLLHAFVFVKDVQSRPAFKKYEPNNSVVLIFNIPTGLFSIK